MKRVPYTVDGVQVGWVEIFDPGAQEAWDNAVKWKELEAAVPKPAPEAIPVVEVSRDNQVFYVIQGGTLLLALALRFL